MKYLVKHLTLEAWKPVPGPNNPDNIRISRQMYRGGLAYDFLPA